MTDPSLISDGSAVWVEEEPQPGIAVAQGLYFLGLNLGKDADTANPDKPFWYLGGPMTGIPQFNFPEFFRVGELLRGQGYNIISPAELDDPETEAAALASEDGAPGSGSARGQTHADFLSRDVVICALPTCLGGIFLPGHENSRGARLEKQVLRGLKKQVMAYFDNESAEGGHLLLDITEPDAEGN